MRIQHPVADAIALLHSLYQKLSPKEPLAALLGATALNLCYELNEDHPQFKQCQEWANYMLSEAANAQGIEEQEAFDTWVVQQRLNDKNFVLSKLDRHLQALVGEDWLFDRTVFLENS